jgi:hypothetical protein
MNALELQKRWKMIEAQLDAACKIMPTPPPEVSERYATLLGEYQEFIAHNELECALDMLQEIGELVPCRGGFWRNLERAAKTMELLGRVPYLHRRFEEALGSTRTNP